MRKITLFMLLMIANFIVIVFPASIASGETIEKQEIKIDVSPNDSLFNVTNMKPGDWAPRTVLVKNNGKMDFDYEVRMQNTGDEKLFNELILEINDGQTELFNGKLADFTSLETRHLASGQEEELEMTVHFPTHSGNEFQGLSTHFTLIFTAEGEKGKRDDVKVDGTVGSDGQSGSTLPKTATNMFNYLVLGGFLVAAGGSLAIYTKSVRHKDDKE